jgi:ribosome biogenesis protein Nip4
MEYSLSTTYLNILSVAIPICDVQVGNNDLNFLVKLTQTFRRYRLHCTTLYAMSKFEYLYIQDIKILVNIHLIL